ncbi:MAG TPA: ATP-dependent helicase [Chthoniobacteraceae bacterium]|jgi:DNA helicase-2/ATP-dependent DNA helicase PcrA|nr:ATP-dependent helicase [Chthoniobacteraceae bacterium]
MSRQYTLNRPNAPAFSIDYAAQLNAQQHEAVTAAPGPALVIAGAGSGKTRTLTYRVAYLVENGVSPSNILLLTFTNKAAREMVERVTALVPHDLTGLWSGTFHSVGNRILRANTEAAGFRAGFSIMDREDQQDMIDSVLAGAGIDTRDKRFPKGEVLADVFSYAINTGHPIGEVLAEKYPYFIPIEEEIAKLEKKYEERKRSANSLDFDDLLVKPLRMLEQKPGVAQHYQGKFQFILVDEYQDTNHIQAEFIDILAAHHKNVMVVGDDAQAIYSWRGANFQNILDFPKRYPGAKIYKIETNYRSVPEVLQVANAAIAANVRQFHKELHAAREGGRSRPALVPLADPNQQAQFVAQRILELRDEGMDLNEMAVLYRAHYHSMELQMELTRHGIPFAITSGLRFFEQAHVKDVAAFLKFAVNPRDEVAFKRMARLLPGIGARSAEDLWAAVYPRLGDTDPAGGEPPAFETFHKLLFGLKVPSKSRKSWEQLTYTLDEIAPHAQPHPPAEMIHAVIEAVYDDYLKSKFPNYEQRREDLQVLENYAKQYQKSADFLDQLALVTSLETEGELGSRDDDDEMVNLSSVHQAKGLEWRVVFVIWMADGMFPSSRSLESNDAIEEERRLFYVAVTRARDELYLSYPLIRLNAGYGEMFQRPSRFLGEVPGGLLEEWSVS